MTKIYDNKDDFVKDKLTEQASDLRHQAHRQESLGFSLMVGSFLADMWNATRKASSTALRWTGSILAIAAIVEWVQSWRTNTRAHDLELQRERMGPTNVVVLDGNTPVIPSAEKECKPCRAKSFTRRTHTQLAAKTDDSTTLPPH